MEKTSTISEMSPAELAKCRENLRHQWENRKVDEELLQRAWQTAHHLATVLYQDYGASKVAVFGSLTTPECFTENSDIDIVVWGISYDRCLDALWGTEGLSTEFKIDIIDTESINRLFRQRILDQAIPIDLNETEIHKIIEKKYTSTDTEIGENYEVNRDQLVKRLSDELKKIKITVNRIERALEKIDEFPSDAREFMERAISADLAEVYTGFEKIFERIANEVDKHLPSGDSWHSDLLTQMADVRSGRPPIISNDVFLRLIELLRFRHKVNNIYGDELIYEKVEQHAKEISQLFEDVSKELDAFTTFLSET